MEEKKSTFILAFNLILKCVFRIICLIFILKILLILVGRVLSLFLTTDAQPT